MRKSSKRNRMPLIPCAITSLSMFAGFLSVYFSIQGYASGNSDFIIKACWLIVIAALFDTLDGRIARLLNASSKFGIEFDSLADIISFGFAPAVIMIIIMINVLPANGFPFVTIICCFLFLLAGAIRLARYNIKTEGKKKSIFAGYPIPAGAIMLISYPIFCKYLGLAINGKFLIPLIILVSLLMVSNIEFNAIPRITITTLKSQFLPGFFILCLIIFAFKPQVILFILSLVYILIFLGKHVYLLKSRHVKEDDSVSTED